MPVCLRRLQPRGAFSNSWLTNTTSRLEQTGHLCVTHHSYKSFRHKRALPSYSEHDSSRCREPCSAAASVCGGSRATEAGLTMLATLASWQAENYRHEGSSHAGDGPT